MISSSELVEIRVIRAFFNYFRTNGEAVSFPENYGRKEMNKESANTNFNTEIRDMYEKCRTYGNRR